MEQLPKIVRQRLQASARVETHPDADLLSAFAENSLTPREREGVISHLSQCADCREVLSLASTELVAEEPVLVGAGLEIHACADTSVPEVPVRRSWFSFPVLRWGVLAACVVVAASVVLLRQERSAKPALMGASKQPPISEQQTSTSTEAPTPATALAGAAPATPSKEIAKTKQQKKETLLAKNEPGEEIALDRETRQKLNVIAPNARPRLAPPPASSAGAAFGTRGSAQGVTLGRAAAAPAPAPPGQSSQPVAEMKELPATGRDVKDTGTELATVELRKAPETAATATAEAKNAKPEKAIPSASEMVEVEAAAPAMQSQAITVSVDKGAVAGAAARSTSQNRTDNFAYRMAAAAVRWTISAAGKVQRSLDQGKTWQTVPVAATSAFFRAVSAFGSEIWAGGNGGALYHSSDSGTNWSQVKPAFHGATLNSDIVRIEFTDAQHGRLTTANQETWTTADGGLTWQKQ